MIAGLHTFYFMIYWLIYISGGIHLCCSFLVKVTIFNIVQNISVKVAAGGIYSKYHNISV